MQIQFDIDSTREALNVVSIISVVHPGLLDRVLGQLKEEEEKAAAPAPVDTKTYDENGVVVQVSDLAVVGSITPKSYTQADVNAAVQAYANAKDVPAAMALLKEFGVAKATQLKPEQFAAFIGRTQETK